MDRGVDALIIDGWMDGWMTSWTDELKWAEWASGTDRLIDGWIDGLICGWMDELIDSEWLESNMKWIVDRVNTLIDEWKDGLVDGWNKYWHKSQKDQLTIQLKKLLPISNHKHQEIS